MSWLNNVLRRSDIQQIREFLLYGDEDGEVDPRSYEKRESAAHEQLTERLRGHFQDKRECEEVTSIVHDYASTIESVYMELGLQIGAKLTIELFRNLHPTA